MIKTIKNGRVHYKGKEGRSRARNMKSIYYDRHINTMAAASKLQHGHGCYLRPNRYIFIGQFSCVPVITNATVADVLTRNNINLSKVIVKPK